MWCRRGHLTFEPHGLCASGGQHDSESVLKVRWRTALIKSNLLSMDASWLADASGAGKCTAAPATLCTPRPSLFLMVGVHGLPAPTEFQYIAIACGLNLHSSHVQVTAATIYINTITLLLAVRPRSQAQHASPPLECRPVPQTRHAMACAHCTPTAASRTTLATSDSAAKVPSSSMNILRTNR